MFVENRREALQENSFVLLQAEGLCTMTEGAGRLAGRCMAAGGCWHQEQSATSPVVDIAHLYNSPATCLSRYLRLSSTSHTTYPIPPDQANFPQQIDITPQG